MPSLIKRYPDDPENPYRRGQIVNGRVICGSKKRTGGTCHSTVLMDSGRCRTHGGATPSGTALPQTKHGRYSKYLRGDLAKSYDEMLADPELVQLRDEIALISARIRQLSHDTEHGNSDLFWKQLTKVWDEFIHAVRTSDEDTQNELLPKLNKIIATASQDRKNWNDINTMIDQRRKLVDVESRRLIQANQYLTIEQAILIATGIIAAIRDAAHRYAEPTVANHILVDAQRAYNAIIGSSAKVKPDNESGSY